MLMKLFGLRGGGRLEKAVTIIEAAKEQSPVIAMQTVSDWMTHELPGFAAKGALLELLRRIDTPLREVLERAFEAMLDTNNNQAKTALLLQAAIPMCDAVLEAYQKGLSEEVPTLSKKPANIPLIQATTGFSLWWQARNYVLRIMRRSDTKPPAWEEIQPKVEAALNLSGGVAAKIARPDGEAGRLQKQLAYLVLVNRSLTQDLHGRQFLIAERLANALAGFIGISTEHSDRTPFGADSAGSPMTLLTQAPTTIVRGGKGLFFGLEKSLSELIALEQLMLSQHKVPAKVDAREMLGVSETLTVIKHLKNRWTGRDIKRKYQRRPVTGEIKVAYEYQALRRLIAQTMTGVDTKTVEDSITICALEDASASGCGIVASHQVSWVKVGRLVGLRGQDEPFWRIGVIRRVIGRGHGKVFAGVQFLSFAPESVRLVEKAKISQWEMVANLQAWDNKYALFVRGSPLTQNQHLLLTAQPELKAGSTYAIPNASDGGLALRVIAQQEIGADFVQYQCEQLLAAEMEPPKA